MARPARRAYATGAMALIYLVEDDAALRSLLAEVFEDEGYTVVVLKTVEQLTCQCERSSGVAVIDGWGVDMRVLGDEERKTIRRVSSIMPTIMLSGRTWVSCTRPEDLGLVALFSKPADLDDLLGLVDETTAALSLRSANCSN